MKLVYFKNLIYTYLANYNNKHNSIFFYDTFLFKNEVIYNFFNVIEPTTKTTLNTL